MGTSKLTQWVLRVAVAGEFLGHGMFALQKKQAWVDWIQQFGVADVNLATQLLVLIGVIDVALAILLLLKPIRVALLWMAFWGFWTALVRPLVGEPILDFVERWANWGAPLTLLLILGWPRSLKDWFR